MDQAQVISQIVAHTPIWAFGLLAALALLGLMATRPRDVRPWRVAMTPAVFIVWGLASLAGKANFSALLAGEWLALAALGASLALATARLRGARLDVATGKVRLPGSVLPLIRNLVIFAVKYALAAAAAMAPAAAPHLAYWDVAVSGLIAGYFVGWMLRFVSLYRGGSPALAEAPTAAAFNGRLE